MMQIKFHNSAQPEWKHFQFKGLMVDYVGRFATVETLLTRLAATCPTKPADITTLLNGLPGHYSIVVRGNGWGLAAVDTVRAFPLFYADVGGKLHLSGNARSVRDAAGISEVNETALLELFMAGYVTGEFTVLKGLNQLQAGEALFWTERSGNALERVRYYKFYTHEFMDADEDDLIEKLSCATDAVFDRLVEDLGGRPVWVPLSAGLDSRLVVAKLVERGYPNIETFSYGRNGNHEAKYAAKVAGALGLPWRFVPTTGEDMRSFHKSRERRAYWEFCDGLSSVPNPQDIVPLITLRRRGELPADAVLVNGQSGDFICGAHLPADLIKKDATIEMFMDTAIERHFALWRDIMTKDKMTRIKEKMRDILATIDPVSQPPSEIAGLLDCWEWQERQAKYVVNGQRIYDFLGLDWRLPLWDCEWMDFWPNVPIEHRLGRGLHKKYLRRWNFRNLFSKPEAVVNLWPGAAGGFFVFAQLVGLFGSDAKDTWYRYARWFGHYGYQWHSYPLAYFLRDTKQARSVLAFFVETWAHENLGIERRDLRR